MNQDLFNSKSKSTTMISFTSCLEKHSDIQERAGQPRTVWSELSPAKELPCYSANTGVRNDRFHLHVLNW
jgi:hypothetical protein